MMEKLQKETQENIRQVTEPVAKFPYKKKTITLREIT